MKELGGSMSEFPSPKSTRQSRESPRSRPALESISEVEVPLEVPDLVSPCPVSAGVEVQRSDNYLSIYLSLSLFKYFNYHPARTLLLLQTLHILTRGSVDIVIIKVSRRPTLKFLHDEPYDVIRLRNHDHPRELCDHAISPPEEVFPFR